MGECNTKEKHPTQTIGAVDGSDSTGGPAASETAEHAGGDQCGGGGAAECVGLQAPEPGDRFAVDTATIGLLTAAAEGVPTLIVVDDAQWLHCGGERATAGLAAAGHPVRPPECDHAA